MKSFTMKVNADKMTFADKEDKAVFVRLLLSLERKGLKYYKITIETLEEPISSKQEKLFDVLVSKIASESGNDRDTVAETLLSNFGLKKEITNFSKEEFSNFIESASEFTLSFFGFVVNFDSSGHIQITKP